MRRLVNAALTDPLVIETARAIVASEGPRDYDAQIAALRSYLQEHLQFTQDPRGVEMLATPRYLLERIRARYVVQGDCDDAAVLGAALAKAVGLRVRFRVLGFYDTHAPFTHVYAIVQGRANWYDLDTTRSPRTVNAPIMRAQEVEV